MSIDSTTKSALYHKKTMKSSLPQSGNHPYSRNSLKNHQNRSHSMNRAAANTEEISGDILTDLSSIPYKSCKQINDKRDRRYSELKPSHIQQVQAANYERRNSTSQINFSALLPNPFRSNKYHRYTTKDESNTTTNTSNSTASLHYNDMVTMKTELPSSLKLSNTAINGSRTNLSTSNDRLSSFVQEEPRPSSISTASSLFISDKNQNHSEPRSAETLKLELHTPLCVGEVYRVHFCEYFHTNYCGEFQQEGPFIASLRYCYIKSTTSDNASSVINGNTYCQARAIIRTPSRNDVVSVIVDGTNEDNILQILFNQAHLSAIHTCKPIGDPKANEKIHLFDKLNDERQNCKIGLIYQRSDQTIEYDIYSNDFLSIDLLDFLQILADRVRLKGFQKYRGDLDIKDDLHGEYSYYTQYQNHEIMFNIAPIIPSTKANGQCIERKGLVGNSFVCIVFQEANAEFSPEFISGKVTQIYITVQPMKIDEKVYYKIGIWHRSDVTSIIDPPSGIYQCDNSFRDYFLTLLLNSINVAIESPSLRGRIPEQRQRLKREELRKLSQNLCTGQILNLTIDLEHVNLQIDQHADSRSESVLSSTTDTMTPNSDRTSPIPPKKRGLSKIFSVFSSRSPSITSMTSSPSASITSTTSSPSGPIPQNLPNHDVSPVNSTPPEISKIVQPPSEEPMRRKLSAKGRRAPPPPRPPPIPPHISFLKTQSVTSIQTPASLQSNISDDHASTNDTLLNTTALEEPARNRSNSSPGNSLNTKTRSQTASVSSISEENDNTDKSVDEDFDDEFSEDEQIEHRRTLTESPLLLSSNINP